MRWRGRRFWVSIDDGPPGELRRRRPLRFADTSGIIGFGTPFSGERAVIDDVCIYDRCLSHDQIRAIWRAEAMRRERNAGGLSFTPRQTRGRKE